MICWAVSNTAQPVFHLWELFYGVVLAHLSNWGINIHAGRLGDGLKDSQIQRGITHGRLIVVTIPGSSNKGQGSRNDVGNPVRRNIRGWWHLAEDEVCDQRRGASHRPQRGVSSSVSARCSVSCLADVFSQHCPLVPHGLPQVSLETCMSAFFPGIYWPIECHFHQLCWWNDCLNSF